MPKREPLRFTVRRVDISDHLIREAIAVMNRQCFPPGYWCGRIRPEAGEWWIALHGQIEAGYAGLMPSYQTDRAGYLPAAAVVPQYRGHGLHLRLLRTRIACARALGWTQLFTETICDNAYSANNLIRCGFRQFNPEQPWGSPFAVYWRRPL